MIAAIDWEEVVNDLGPRLYRYFSTCFSDAYADDCVQETLIRLMHKVSQDTFDPSKGNLRMYAYGIAHFVRLEGLRSESSCTAQELEEDLVCPEAPTDERLDDKWKVKQLRERIATLSEIQQQIIALYLDQELKISEIGTLLGLPEGTVKSHLHRAKETLKKLIQENVCP